MRKSTLFLLTIIFFVSSCKKTVLQPAETTSEGLISTETIDAFIKKQIESSGTFEWQSASDQMVWSALQQSDNILSIGYKTSAITDVDNNVQNININERVWLDVKESLINMVLISERTLDKSITIEKIIPWEEHVLPVIDIVVKNPATIKLLRANSLVRYVEPMGYEPKAVVLDLQKQNLPDNAITSSSGCGSNTSETGLLEGIDYTAILPNAKQSWNYNYHSIPKTWSKTSGAGVKVFIIDTGCEFDQENLGSSFNQGYSSGRTIEKIVTLPRATTLGIPTGPVETADDGCGHGTSMAGACAGPRGTDGNACGVAYNCNLVTCRAAADVYLDESREVKGASDAFTNAANRADVKIISMSMGKITSSSQLRDAILYAYGKSKLIFCAGGTSFSWTSGWFGVIYPATLTQVNAVTGVFENNVNASCTYCHDGSETDFTVVMDKSNGTRYPLTLAMSGDVPSTVGGSSVATATTAGIAALVWSKFPSYTRDQVLNKLVVSSSNYPNRNSSLGWGNINADAATN